MIQEPNKDKKIQALAEEVMKLAHDSVTMRFRFFDTALSRIRYEWVTGLCGAGFTSKLDTLQIDPVWFLQEYMEAESLPLRLLLHGMLHLIFLHPFQYDKLLSREWDLACDIAVENIILTLLSDTSVLSSDSDKKWRWIVYPAASLP